MGKCKIVAQVVALCAAIHCGHCTLQTKISELQHDFIKPLPMTSCNISLCFSSILVNKVSKLLSSCKIFNVGYMVLNFIPYSRIIYCSWNLSWSSLSFLHWLTSRALLALSSNLPKILIHEYQRYYSCK